MLKRNVMLMNQTDGNNNGGGNTGAEKTQTDSSTQAQGSSDTDILNSMYSTEETKVEEKTDTKANEQQTQEGKQDDKVSDPSVTGYGDEPKIEEKKVDDKKEDESKVEFNAEGLSEDGKTLVQDFVKKNNLSKEAAQAFADHVKLQNKIVSDMMADQKRLAEEKTKTVQNEWQNQLKIDKDFGGELYKQNLKRVDVVLDKLFPNTKNLLTSTKGMLPPSIMKDLLAVHKQFLAGDDQMVNAQEGVKNDNPYAFLGDLY